MKQIDVSIKVFEVMGYLNKDINNIVKKLKQHSKNNPEEPSVVLASVIGSLCFTFISIVHHSFWQEVMIKIAQELGRMKRGGK